MSFNILFFFSKIRTLKFFVNWEFIPAYLNVKNGVLAMAIKIFHGDCTFNLFLSMIKNFIMANNADELFITPHMLGDHKTTSMVVLATNQKVVIHNF